MSSPVGFAFLILVYRHAWFILLFVFVLFWCETNREEQNRSFIIYVYVFSLEDNGCCFFGFFLLATIPMSTKSKKISSVSSICVLTCVSFLCIFKMDMSHSLSLYMLVFSSRSNSIIGDDLAREKERGHFPFFQLRSLPKAENIELLGKWIFLRIFSWIGSGARRLLIALHQQQGWEFESILMNYHISQRWIGRADWCSLIDKQLQIHWDLYDLHRPRFLFFVLRDDSCF